MALIVIKLNPEELSDPNLDIRYVLPDLVIERSGGAAEDSGFDYAGERPDMYIFLSTDCVAQVLPTVLSLVENETVLGNDLQRAAEVAVSDGTSWLGVYPAGCTFTLPPEVQGHL